MKILYLECAMGAAGDMLLSALYELLSDKEGFLSTLNGLGLPGVRVEALPAVTSGITGTRLKVTVHGQEEGVPCTHAEEHPHPAHGHDGHHHDGGHHDHDHDGHCHGDGHHDHDEHHHHGDEPHEHSHSHSEHHHHADPGHIAAIIDTLPLSPWVLEQARAVYSAIAQAEATAHGCPVGDVHFHEVGALDAVADVVGVCYAVWLLNPDKIVCSPVHVGSGQVRCAHGVMPVPAPATAALLTGVPCYGGQIQGELCTPTGAALLRHFAAEYGPMPVMAAEKIGYGVGSREFEAANCVRAFWGEFMGQKPGPKPDDEICELCCNLDDMTPEALAFAAQRLLEGGALDVSYTPVQMKKGRPGLALTVLCAPDREGETAERILAETTTNGVRVRRCAKYILTPSVRTVETEYGPMRVKCAQGHGVSRAKPEYDDVARLARERGLPFRAVWDAVETKI